jgi:hypothetical protein
MLSKTAVLPVNCHLGPRCEPESQSSIAFQLVFIAPLHCEACRVNCANAFVLYSCCLVTVVSRHGCQWLWLRKTLPRLFNSASLKESLTRRARCILFCWLTENAGKNLAVRSSVLHPRTKQKWNVYIIQYAVHHINLSPAPYRPYP